MVMIKMCLFWNKNILVVNRISNCHNHVVSYTKENLIKNSFLIAPLLYATWRSSKWLHICERKKREMVGLVPSTCKQPWRYLNLMKQIKDDFVLTCKLKIFTNTFWLWVLYLNSYICSFNSWENSMVEYCTCILLINISNNKMCICLK